MDDMRIDESAGVVTDALDGTPIPELNDAPVEALAQALTFQGKLYAAANEHERMAESPDAFFGPFDPKVAWTRLAELSTHVDEARVDHERAKASAKTARDRYEEANNELNDLLRELKAWERGEDERQPRLRTIPEDENAHERRQRLTEQLKEKDCYLLPTELELLERGDLDTLDAWLTQSGPIPPELLKHAHIADDDQCCSRCGLKLGEFPLNAFVGLDCTGAEPARRTPKRKKTQNTSDTLTNPVPKETPAP